jgi:hypothetical protein
MYKKVFSIFAVLLFSSSVYASVSCTCYYDIRYGGNQFVSFVSSYTSSTHCGDRGGVTSGGVISNDGYVTYVDSISGIDAFNACN